MNKCQPLANFSTHLPSFDACYPNLQLLCCDPPIYVINNFLDSSMCDLITSHALISQDKLDTSRTYMSGASSTGSKADSSRSVRNSTTFYLKDHQLEEVYNMVSLLTGSSATTFEEPQVIRYTTGQLYAWHQDAIPPHRVNRHAGNRLATVLIYLNTLPISSTKSGYTTFKSVDVQVRPEQGKCLVFFPCFADGTPDPRSVHCSNVIEEDGVEKWALQIWVHERPYLL